MECKTKFSIDVEFSFSFKVNDFIGKFLWKNIPLYDIIKVLQNTLYKRLFREMED